jgi:hypothetical protein
MKDVDYMHVAEDTITITVCCFLYCYITNSALDYLFQSAIANSKCRQS